MTGLRGHARGNHELYGDQIQRRSTRTKIRRACGGKVADWCYPVHRETCDTCRNAP